MGGVTVGWSMATCTPAVDGVRSIDELRRAALHTFNERELDEYLQRLASEMPASRDRLVHIARKAVGQPYRLFLLGEFPYELHDADPLYCLSASDCVTFVEQSYAMALADDWPSFFRTLQRLRYRNGRIGIRTRNHFTEADWNANNAWLFDVVTPSLAGADLRLARVRTDRSAFLRQYDLYVARPVEWAEVPFIARQDWPRIADDLRPGDVVEFVRGDADAPYVSHMGIILRDADGRPTLIHATEPAVREEPLADYVERCQWITGMVYLRMKDGASPPEAASSAVDR
jgi:cell wall-associated NlpC family hydrolase